MKEISSLMSRGMRHSPEGFFGNLNRDGKIIILSDSDEEEEVREEKATDAEATPSSTVRSRASTTSMDDADGTYKSNTPRLGNMRLQQRWR
jgi:hypothetical protein